MLQNFYPCYNAPFKFSRAIVSKDSNDHLKRGARYHESLALLTSILWCCARCHLAEVSLQCIFHCDGFAQSRCSKIRSSLTVESAEAGLHGHLKHAESFKILDCSSRDSAFANLAKKCHCKQELRRESNITRKAILPKCTLTSMSPHIYI